MPSLSPSTRQALQDALDRSRNWIRAHLRNVNNERCTDSYIEWILDRLSQRIGDDTKPEDLDGMIREELRAFVAEEERSTRRYSEHHTSHDFLHQFPDPASVSFAQELETADELRACLECVPKEYRELLLAAYTLTKNECSDKEARDILARKLGISRAALDQRLARARAMIRRARASGDSTKPEES